MIEANVAAGSTSVCEWCSPRGSFASDCLNRSTVNLAHAKVTASNGRAANAFVVTNTGATAGLVAITPASGEVGSMPAVLIGLGAGVFCCGAAGHGAAGHKVYYRDASTGGGKTESKTE